MLIPHCECDTILIRKVKDSINTNHQFITKEREEICMITKSFIMMTYTYISVLIQVQTLKPEYHQNRIFLKTDPHPRRYFRKENSKGLTIIQM